jgi:hypothetical protein
VRTRHDRGKFFGLMPTGKVDEAMAIVIHRIVGGKVAEEWGASETSSLLKEIEQQARKHELVEQELRVASRIQHASLPKEVPELEGWKISPLYRPAREVGGDF